MKLNFKLARYTKIDSTCIRKLNVEGKINKVIKEKFNKILMNANEINTK